MNLSIRYASMVVDSLIGILIFVPIWNFIDFYILQYRSPIGFYFAMIYLTNKDFFVGKSIAKRLFRMQIIDYRTNMQANEYQCFLRNLTTPFYPIEVIFTFFSPQRRIGDWLAGTKLITVEKQNIRLFFTDIKQYKPSTRIIWIIFSLIIYFYLFNILIMLWAGDRKFIDDSLQNTNHKQASLIKTLIEEKSK